jgi:hypothetical protein
MVAQTMLRQLVSKVQDVDLNSPLAHEAPEAFNGIGGLNVSLHGWRKRHHFACTLCAIEPCLAQRRRTQDDSPLHGPIFKREPGLRSEGLLSQ